MGRGAAETCEEEVIGSKSGLSQARVSVTVYVSSSQILSAAFVILAEKKSTFLFGPDAC